MTIAVRREIPFLAVNFTSTTFGSLVTVGAGAFVVGFVSGAACSVVVDGVAETVGLVSLGATVSYSLAGAFGVVVFPLRLQLSCLLLELF